jgi:DNA-binding transcriptional MerR regulator
MKRKELTEKTGLDRETLKFYEKKGIILEPARDDSGYREYDLGSIERIEFTKMAKSAGFTLTEIKELLDLKNSGVSCRKGRDIALSKLEEVEEKMESLNKMKRVLNKFVDACNSNGEEGLKKRCHLNFDLVWRG